MIDPSKISIGVPTYNHGRFLAETLDKILSQSTPPGEIVVCNNHSTDDTEKILRTYGDKVRVIMPPAHLPMMANWNHLVGEMRSEWVALISSDDLARPNYVEAIIKGAQLSDKAVLVGGQHSRIDGNGQTIGKPSRLPVGVSTPNKNLANRLHSPLNSFNGTAFRRDAWQRVGGFPEMLKLAGDWGFWVRLAPLGDFVTLKETLVDYRVGYRSEKEDRGRMWMWAQDYEHLYRIMMPEAASQCPNVSMSQIRTAMQIRCHNFLCSIARELSAEERVELAEKLGQWATDCNVIKSLEKFRSGKRLRRERMRKLKHWLSGFFDKD